MFIKDSQLVATDLPDGTYGRAEIHEPQEDGKNPIAQELAAWMPKHNFQYESVVVLDGAVVGYHWHPAAGVQAAPQATERPAEAAKAGQPAAALAAPVVERKKPGPQKGFGAGVPKAKKG